ncbi:acyl-CoA dehydrogenase family protein [Streptomyces xanthochromogenes]|uniref:acyl-CoA dehydrogenase family protein n=1 Tax=Streptomyces xanthochromogenes TaxID=67384 RepID=UPI001676987C|nr:acyl-CoA dehydrogenase [Streptomyces xanthochromogenes]
MTITAPPVALRTELRGAVERIASTAHTAPQPLPAALLRQMWQTAAQSGCLTAAADSQPQERHRSLAIAEELGRQWLLDLPLWMQSDVVPSALRRHGTADQKGLLPGCASGSTLLAVALSEAESASSLTNLTTTARSVDDGYVLDGEKRYVTNAVIADILLVSAAVATTGRTSVGLFLVSADSAGITVEPTSMGRGLELLGSGTVNLSGVRVPETALLGGRPLASFQLGPVLSVERLFLSLMSCAAAWAVVEGVQHVGSAPRRAGSLLSHSAVQVQMAELAERLTCVTSLVQSLCSTYVQHGTVPADLAAIAKHETVKVLMAALGVERSLSGAAALTAAQDSSRLDLENRCRSASAQALAGGAPHALHAITLAGLAGKGGHVQIV